MTGLARGDKLTRFALYQELGKVADQLPGRTTARTLVISHSHPLCDLFRVPAEGRVEANYPEHNILSLRFPDNEFDFVVSDFVLEHVEGNPEQAMEECRRVLKPGGVAIHTTAFNYHVHGAPNDYWRFTPSALAWLHRRFGQVIATGGWGNQWVWVMVYFGLRKEGVPLARWHPFHRIATRNDRRWPITTWVVARK
ncbi:MAG TPA: methyltransferase domain-containing protein [Verrucomicrobiae bacterium]|nr:methyltransferase domain-containing protein [Verrucomicrobiae bacterium]